MPVDTIIFDLDDTLIYDEASADEAIRQVCREAAGERLTDCETFRQVIRRAARERWYAAPQREYVQRIGCSSWEGLWMEIRRADCAELEALREWLPGYCRETWSDGLRSVGIQDLSLAEEMTAAYSRNRRSMSALCEDAVPVLDSLHGRYRLGLLTNGQVDLQQDKIDLAGIRDYFDVIVVSGEIGVGKPDPYIFEYTLRRLGSDTTGAVMVGNSLRSDIAGANGVGLKAVWIKRGSIGSASEAVPDATLTSLHDLAAVLDSFR